MKAVLRSDLPAIFSDQLSLKSKVVRRADCYDEEEIGWILRKDDQIPVARSTLGYPSRLALTANRKQGPGPLRAASYSYLVKTNRFSPDSFSLKA